MSTDGGNRSDSIRQGHYARKQLASKVQLMAWAHAARFRTAVRLGQQFAGGRVLDYGSGDGTFLALLTSGPFSPARAVGAEVSAQIASECSERLGNLPGLTFVTIATLDDAEHEGAYDAVFCTEVLEHLVDVDSVLRRLERLLTPTGILIVSVPVETGLPLIVKQVFRHVAAWRGMRDYPGIAPYTIGEFFRSLFAGRSQHILRPVHRSAQGEAHDHKGFNWRVVKEKVGARFMLQRTIASPIAWLPPSLGSQVWLVATRRP